MTKHTPGEWKAKHFSELNKLNIVGINFDTDNEKHLCILSGENQEANARLIAAAPNMYKAIKLVLDKKAAGYYPFADDFISELQSAIAKVEAAQ